MVELLLMTETVENQSQAQTITSLMGLINATLSKIKNLQGELTEKRHMKEDAFKNDSTYKQNDDKVKEVTKARQEVKQAIVKQPEMLELENNIKDNSQSLKELKEGLSTYLVDYAKLSGQNTIETPDGEVMQIKYSAKLVRPEEKFV